MRRLHLTLILVLFAFAAACGSEDGNKGSSDDDLRFQPPTDNVEDPGEDPDAEAPGPELPPPPTDCTLDLDCDDSNPCTSGSCIQGQCVYQDLDGTPCDDGDPCTLDDLCQAGSCASVPLDCEDGNACTIDSCKNGECKVKVDDSLECRLRIVVDTPERAATIHAGGAVEVSGEVISPAGPLQYLKLNGETLSVKADGTFSTARSPVPGINILDFVARDVFDRADKSVRSFLFSEELYQVGTDKALVYMSDATRIFLRHDVWDDDNTGDVDDIATVIFKVVNNLDLNEMIPEDLVYEGICTWDIDVSQISFALQTLDLDPDTGILQLSGNFINLAAWVDAVAPWCPDAHGWVYADNVWFDATFDVDVANGAVDIELAYTDVEITGIELDLQEGLASYFDWIVNWFSGTFSDMVEGQLETALPDQVVPMLVSLLNEFLEQEQQIDIPPVPGTTSSLPLVLRTDPEAADFSPGGSEFVVSIGVGSKKLIQHTAPGTFKRGDCKGTDTGVFYLPKSQKVEAAVSEDLINQSLFGLWWGGHFTVSLTSDILDPLLEGFQVSGLVVSLDPYLPPIFTTCTPSGKPELQMGDLEVWASFSFGDQNGEVELFASIAVEVEVIVVGNALGLKVGEVTRLGLDVVDAQGMMKGNEDLAEQILTEVVVNILIKEYLADVLAAYPIPGVNLGQLAPEYFPPGTLVKFQPAAAKHSHGFILLTGAPK